MSKVFECDKDTQKALVHYATNAIGYLAGFIRGLEDGKLYEPIEFELDRAEYYLKLLKEKMPPAQREKLPIEYKPQNNG
jgi:hypothetical protein